MWLEGFLLLLRVCPMIVTGINFSEKRLQDDLFRRIDKHIRPEANFEQPIHVYLDFVLDGINTLSVRDESLDVNAFSALEWFDPQLKWNASAYGGIDDARLDPKQLWTPDVALFNSNTYRRAEESDIYTTFLSVENNGSIKWISPTNWVSSCSCDVTWFPWDTQDCDIIFGAWSYDKRQLILRRGPMMTTHKQRNYQQVSNGEWKVTHISSYDEEQSFRGMRSPHSIVRINIKATRRPLSYVLYTILPQIALIFSFLVIFHMDVPARSAYGVTILLTLSVFLLVIEAELPPKSDDWPFLGLTFVVEFFLLCVGVPLAEFSGHFSMLQSGHPPEWLLRCCDSPCFSYSLITPLRKTEANDKRTENVEMEEAGNNSNDISHAVSSDNMKKIDNTNEQWCKVGRCLDKVFTGVFCVLIILIPVVLGVCII